MRRPVDVVTANPATANPATNATNVPDVADLTDPTEPAEPGGAADALVVIDAPTSSRRRASASSAVGERGLARAVVVVGALAGFAVRLAILVSTKSIGRPDSDEIIAGLMARRIGVDGYPAFFWGQSYGGTPTLGLVGASLRIFGNSVVAMRLPGFLLACICSVLVWRVAGHLLSKRGAQLAGLLSWIAFPPAIYFSVREHLFYVPVVLFGLTASLFAFRLRERHHRLDWVGLAVSLALGLWCMPTIIYFALPAVAVVAGPALARASRRPGRTAALVAVGATVAVAAGSLAYVWITRGTPKDWTNSKLDYVANLRFFFTDGLPGLLGFREIFTYRWIGGGIGVLAYLAVLGVLAFGVARAVRRRSWDAVGLLAFPFIFSLFPKATDQPNMRYLYFAIPFVAIALARAVELRRRLPYVALVAAALVTTIGLQHLYTVSEVDRTARVGMVGDLDEARTVLEQEHVRAVYANYWIAYRLDFESAEQIVATPPFKEGRFPPYDAAVAADPLPAWVVERGPQLDALHTSLQRLGVGTRERAAGEFVVVIPDRKVSPAELGLPALAVI